MTPPVTLIRSDRAWPDSVLAAAGTGRHRGSHADEERCSPGGDLSGHGRHRRTARALLVPQAEVTGSGSDAAPSPLTAG
ncbi:hypothetical protein [Streptomyces chromofuscus]|uniref:hypothetical protein n=1 Tax=Streptomyces chromofuscus TaxID=42881 RepID=UPI0016766A09|nr:hypothetical protein [Streptomyces chromofuscus]GGT03198.1 hypothetical protein GCM10010254_24400 [Streptomyces chromofuscus]